MVGVPLAANKTVGPSTEMEFLGITLDAVRREARLPVDKLKRCEAMLSKFTKLYKSDVIRIAVINRYSFFCMLSNITRSCIYKAVDRSNNRDCQALSPHSFNKTG